MSIYDIEGLAKAMAPLSECHSVPIGAIIPADTPRWVVQRDESAAWYPRGFGGDVEVRNENPVYYTQEQIIAPETPTPSDSPIIITEVRYDSLPCVVGTLAFWQEDGERWCSIGEGGVIGGVQSYMIVGWSRAIITSSGDGVWDERDKRPRTDGRNTWYWLPVHSVWTCYSEGASELFGSLNAIREHYGNGFLTGFAE